MASVSPASPGEKLVAIRVADRPDNPTVPNDRLEAALQWADDHRDDLGITIVNVSFGFGHDSTPNTSGVFQDEIAALVGHGISVFAASGNDGISSGQGIKYPASDPNTISVGSVDSFDVIPDFTERSALRCSHRVNPSLARSSIPATATSRERAFLPPLVPRRRHHPANRPHLQTEGCPLHPAPPAVRRIMMVTMNSARPRA